MQLNNKTLLFLIIIIFALTNLKHEVITKTRNSYNYFNHNKFGINHLKWNNNLSHQKVQNINPILKSEFCYYGQHSRIIGGNIANEKSFLYAAAIYSCEKQTKAVSVKDCSQICGGSIISRHHILTAAHCMFNPGNISKKRHHREMLVRVGVHDLKTPEVISGKHRTTFPVKNIIVHDNFVMNDPFLLDDVALIRLRYAIVFTEFIQPICVNGLHLRYDLRAHSKVVVAGWGNIAQDGPVSDILKYTTLDMSQCSEYADSANVKQFCVVADSEINGYVCNGDSGSGLLPLDDNNVDSINVIVGILSGSGYFSPDGVAWCDDPMYFVNVTTYAQWINEHVT